MIYDSIKLIQNNALQLNESNSSQFARKHIKEVKSIGSNSSLVKYLLSLGLDSIKKSETFFSNNSLWIEVWSGLNDNQKIRKMLMLNAGHKSVSIKHQLELLFSGVYLDFEKILPSDISIKREKDQSSIQYSKSRAVGIYNFSHLISALISLSACKAVNTNSDFISELQSGEVKDVDLLDGFNIDMLKIFVELIHSFDKELSSQYADDGVKWLGREVVVVGMFGAIGTVAKNKNEEITSYLKYLIINVKDIVNMLELDKFERIRNNVEFNKVNIGNVNKNAVYRAFVDILQFNEFKSWSSYFGVNE